MASFLAGGGATGVAVHGIALPDGEVAAGADGADVEGEEKADFLFAVAGDEGDFAGMAEGVDEVEEGDELSRGERWTNFNANGVLDAPDVFNVGTCQLACAVANPEKVGGGVVVAVCG